MKYKRKSNKEKSEEIFTKIFLKFQDYYSSNSTILPSLVKKTQLKFDNFFAFDLTTGGAGSIFIDLENLDNTIRDLAKQNVYVIEYDKFIDFIASNNFGWSYESFKKMEDNFKCNQFEQNQLVTLIDSLFEKDSSFSLLYLKSKNSFKEYPLSEIKKKLNYLERLWANITKENKKLIIDETKFSFITEEMKSDLIENLFSNDEFKKLFILNNENNEIVIYEELNKFKNVEVYNYLNNSDNFNDKNNRFDAEDVLLNPNSKNFLNLSLYKNNENENEENYEL